MSGIAQEEKQKTFKSCAFRSCKIHTERCGLAIHIYGWTSENGKLFLNPEEAKMVQLIFEKYALGTYSPIHWNNFYGNVDTEIICNGLIAHDCQYLSEILNIRVITMLWKGIS